MQEVTEIRWDDRLIALVVRNGTVPETTEFLTPDDSKFQLGFIRHPGGHVIQPHLHRDVERTIRGTAEALLVRSGCVEVRFYSPDKKLLCREILREGDLLLQLEGGHGFTMLEETVLLEIKQGPYPGQDEKERF